MSHYPHLDPAVKQRCARLGIDIEQSTTAFLAQLREGTGVRRGFRAYRDLSALMYGPTRSLLSVEQEQVRDRAVRHEERRAA